jgi:regulator of cell morphogenesis and NO signaling
MDYRSADVFRKFGIDYCCGGKWPLKIACEMRGLDVDSVVTDLQKAMRNITISPNLDFETWEIDFLTDYIVQVHHRFMEKFLPDLKEHLEKFVQGHVEKFPYLEKVLNLFRQLYKEVLPHMKHEEEIIFPYIRQIAHAYKNKESYAGLLVRTLRKPIELVMDSEHETFGKSLMAMRELTGQYTAPLHACINHVVVLKKLEQLDNDITQHIYLESDILFPRAIAMEKELL